MALLNAIVVSGPNGAGKTTFTRQFLPAQHPDAVFLNADEIQRESPEFSRPVGAGKELLRRLAAAERAKKSFGLETTLSSRLYVRRIAMWKAAGYRTTLHFIELPSVDYALARVAKRVASGGHAIPTDDVRRRFHRGLGLFHKEYKKLFSQWYHWYSDDRGLRLVK